MLWDETGKILVFQLAGYNVFAYDIDTDKEIPREKLKHIKIPEITLSDIGFADTHLFESNENEPSDQLEYEVYLLHEGLYRVAKESIQTLTANSPEAKEELKKRCWTHLQVYVSEVDDLRKEYDWDILQDELYENARKQLQKKP